MLLEVLQQRGGENDHDLMSKASLSLPFYIEVRGFKDKWSHVCTPTLKPPSVHKILSLQFSPL